MRGVEPPISYGGISHRRQPFYRRLSMPGKIMKWLVIVVILGVLSGAPVEVSGQGETLAAVQGTASISTVVFDAATNKPISGILPLDATVYDTSFVDHTPGPAPTGTVTYTFFRSGTCYLGTVVGIPEVVTLNEDGAAPDSADHGPLTAADGPYAFLAVYSGDSNYTGSVSACEPLEVGQAPTSVTTTLYDASTSQPAPASLPVGATVYDTSVVHHTGSPTPTGTVTYTFFRSGTCSSGTVTGTEVVTLNANGAVPDSADHGPLTAADSPYAFQAIYSGDSNYTGGASDCEPLTVVKASPTLSTQLKIKINGIGYDLQNPVFVDATVYDTASLSGAYNPTGTISYKVYSDNTCKTQIADVTPFPDDLSGGVIPDSADRIFKAIGNWWYQAVYSGDGNNDGATSSCASERVAVGYMVYLPLVDKP